MSQPQEGLRACSACGEERGPEGYSKKQWSARAHSRKCKHCVDASAAGAAEDTHGATPAQLAEQLKGLDVRSRSPCVPEADGRLVYLLMGCLGVLALRQINDERAELCMEPLEFDGRDAQRNELRTRTLVYRYVMAHIDELGRRFCADSAASADAKLVKRTLGRRPTAHDLSVVRSWSAHVDGDFWVVGTVDDGTVLVQLGDFHGPGSAFGAQPWTPEDKEVVFVVKGLADPLSAMVARALNPNAHVDVEGGPGFPVVQLTIVPAPDGTSLTYTSVCTPSRQLGHSTPKQIHLARARAEQVPLFSLSLFLLTELACALN